MDQKFFENQLLRLCRELIKRKSLSGEEKELADFLKGYLEANHFDEVMIDPCGSVVALIKGERDGPTILFDGHMDTVPVTESHWKHDPFAAEISDGKLFGRGTSDMKGGIAAFLSAIIAFASGTRKQFSGKIAVSLTTFEETFEGVTARYISERLKPDFVVIAESTGLRLNIGQRGRAEIVCETYGKTAHSSNPEKGVNAVHSMMKLLQSLQDLPVKEHRVLGKGILVLTDMISLPYPGASVIPGLCRATFDRRLLPDETKESVLAPIQDKIAALAAENENFKAKAYLAEAEGTCYTGLKIHDEKFFPAWLFHQSEPFINVVLDEFRKDQIPLDLSAYSFCTNGSHFAGEKGIKTLGYGPSVESLAHTDDEYIELEQLFAAFYGYKRIITALSESGNYK